METYRVVRSRFDRLNLDVVEVLPEGEVKGIVQISHGMQEHKERYLDFMEFLARHGYVCIAHDHRGHGKSVKSRDDLGYFYDDSAEAVVEDLADVAADLRLRYPHVPFILLGHSMGSLIARKYLKKHDDEIDALILTGAPGNNPGTKAGLILLNALSKTKGDHAESALVNKMVAGGFDRAIKGGGKNSWLSVNEDNVRAFNEDPDSGFPFTINGYQNLLKLVKDDFDEKGWQMKNKNLPVLFLAGSDDPVIGGKDGFEGSVKFLQDRGYSDVQGKLYPGMRHEILNETDKKKVYQEILQFLDRICEKKK